LGIILVCTNLEHVHYDKVGQSMLAKKIGFVSVSLLLSGCVMVPPHRSHPSLEAKAKGIKTVAILPPRVDIFQIDAGGVREKMDEWSTQAKKNIEDAVRAELHRRTGFLITPRSQESLPEEVKSNLEETYSLFDAVNTSILLHTYFQDPNYRFEEKMTNFDYSLGKEVKGLAKEGVEILFLVSGTDHVWTGGRQALQAIAVIIGIGAGVATGVMVLPALGGGTAINVALVDARSGEILWYNVKQSGGGVDLRDPKSAADLVKDLLEDFPIGKKIPEEVTREEQ
jgi:hypothetical protein